MMIWLGYDAVNMIKSNNLESMCFYKELEIGDRFTVIYDINAPKIKGTKLKTKIRIDKYAVLAIYEKIK